MFKVRTIALKPDERHYIGKYHLLVEMEVTEARNISVNLTYHNNMTFDMDTIRWFEAAKLVRSIFVVLIATIGLFGNTLTMIVFLTKGMKNSSCSVFLSALAFVDNTFLLSLLVSWIDVQMVAILKSNVACQLLIFITYVTSFLSVWFIVGFTCERFVAICFPLKGKQICNMFREKLVVLVLTLMACLMYMFTFWTTGIEQWGQINICYHKVEYFLFLKVATWVDTFLTMIIPFGVITAVNCLILRTVRRGPVRVERRRQCRNGKRLSVAKSGNNSTVVESLIMSANRRTSLIRVTRTLFLVSTTFLLLNLPSHIIRMYNLLTVTSNGVETDIWFYILQEFSLLLYYSTFSCNFVLYTLFGRNFKQSLLLVLKCRPTTKRHKENVLQKLNYSRIKTSSV